MCKSTPHWCLRARPKSEILATSDLGRRTFLSARSPCTMFLRLRNSMPLAICRVHLTRRVVFSFPALQVEIWIWS